MTNERLLCGIKERANCRGSTAGRASSVETVMCATIELCEITPEMIEAGVDALLEHHTDSFKLEDLESGVPV